MLRTDGPNPLAFDEAQVGPDLRFRPWPNAAVQLHQTGHSSIAQHFQKMKVDRADEAAVRRTAAIDPGQKPWLLPVTETYEFPNANVDVCISGTNGSFASACSRGLPWKEAPISDRSFPWGLARTVQSKIPLCIALEKGRRDYAEFVITIEEFV